MSDDARSISQATGRRNSTQPSTNYHAFISYSRIDIAFVHKLYDALSDVSSDLDREIWVDWHISPTEKWRKAIYTGIEESDNFICVLSPEFLASEMCNVEVQYAIKCKKRLVPIVRREVHQVYPELAEIQWIEFQDTDNWEDSFRTLNEALVNDLEYVHEGKRLLVRSREWVDAKPKQKLSLALQGDVLKKAEHWLAKAADKKPGATEMQEKYISYSRRAASIRQRKLFGAISIGLIIVLLLSIISVFQYQSAQSNGESAKSRALAAKSNTYLLQNQVDLALLLSVKAYQTNDNYDTRDSVLTALEYSPHMVTMLSHNPSYLGTGSGTAIQSDVAFSPDGKTLVSSTDHYGDLQLWNMITRKSHSLLQSSTTQGFGVKSVAISPDGTLLASAGWNVLGPAPGSIVFWNMKTGTQIAEIKTTGNIETLAFSPNGKYLAFGDCGRYAKDSHGADYCTQGLILFWDVTSKKIVGSPLIDNTGPICRLIFSPDGRYLASRNCEKSDSYPLNIGNECTLGNVLLWDITKVHPTSRTLTTAQNEVSDIEFSPDGRLLATGEGNGEILLWAVESGQRLPQTLLGHTDRVCRMAFNRDGSILASGGKDDTLRLWNTKTWTQLGQPLLGHRDEILSLAFSPNGWQLASGDFGGAIILWDVRHFMAITQQLGDTSQFQQGQTPNALPGMTSIVFNPKRDVMAIGYSNGKITLWDMKTRKSIGILEVPHENEPNFTGESLAFNGDGSILATGSYYDKYLKGKFSGSKVLLWDVKTMKLLADLSYANQQQASINSLAFSPDGHTLAAGGNVFMEGNNVTNGGTIVLWNVATRKVMHQATLLANQRYFGNQYPGNGISHIAFSPDGQTVASSGDDGAIFWNVSSGLSNMRVIDHLGADSIAYSPDGSLFAVGEGIGYGYKITLWDVSTRKQVGQPLTNHSLYGLGSIAFSPNGKLLVAGDGGSINLWDVTTGEQVVHPILQTGAVVNTIFNSDGQLLLYEQVDGSSGKSSVNWLDTSISSWVALACNTANRNFSSKEWNQLFPGEPYHDVCPGYPKPESV